MPWPTFSDDYPEDCWTLSDVAFRLHTEALCWSARKLLDCVIPKDDLRRFAKHPDAAAELVAVGWWSQTAETYIIRHHAGYQRTRVQVLHQQAVNQRNALRGGRPRKAPTPSAETDSVSDPVSDSSTEKDRKGKERNGHWSGSFEPDGEHDFEPGGARHEHR